MHFLSTDVQNILVPFAALFSNTVWLHAQVLIIGSVLCTGKRTVTSALRIMGLSNEKKFTNYHRVLNKAKWNSLHAVKILLSLLIVMVAPYLPIIIAIDETVERRKGKKIKAKGCYRDAVRSTQNKVIHCFGLKWISMQLIVSVPWARRAWSLPFFTVSAPSKAGDKANGKRHETTVDQTRQMIMKVRRWLPDRAIVLGGDGAYAAVSLALCCAGLPMPVTLVARFRLDAALYDPPPPDQPGKRGPKPKKGKRQASLVERIKDPTTIWSPIKVLWYDGVMRNLEIFSGTSLWYTPGYDPVCLKWVVVRDPNSQLRTEAFFCTDLNACACQIIRWFVLRWNIEVTFEELRAHLGVETQRQWSDLAIIRTTPALFGMFSIVVLIALEICNDGNIPVFATAWYKKSEATFSDVIALVRRHIWSSKYYANSGKNHDISYFSENLFETMLAELCYGT